MAVSRTPCIKPFVIFLFRNLKMEISTGRYLVTITIKELEGVLTELNKRYSGRMCEAVKTYFARGTAE